MHKNKTGIKGEYIAGKYLEKHGYQIIKRNWYCYAGELDIIATLQNINDLLIFVEIKTVNYNRKCKAYELYTQKKRINLVKTINHYLDLFTPRDIRWRLDLICVTLININRARIVHYKNLEI